MKNLIGNKPKERSLVKFFFSRKEDSYIIYTLSENRFMDDDKKYYCCDTPQGKTKGEDIKDGR